MSCASVGTHGSEQAENRAQRPQEPSRTADVVLDTTSGLSAASDDRCVVCERTFRPNSRPRWAFTEAGRPAGRVHASCRRARSRWPIMIGPYESVVHAQFVLWWIDFLECPERGTVAYDAWLLLENPTETLSARQDEMLTGWVRGPRQLTVSRVLEIVASHTALVQEFHRWRAALDAEPAGEGGE